MTKNWKWYLLAAAAAAVLSLSGCSNAPDTVEDPLTFGIDAVLPFATVAPEALAPTPTPRPTPNLESTPSAVDQAWKQETPAAGDYGEEEPVTPVATPASGYAELSRGDTGSEVTRLQKRLISLGYLNGSADGSYGQATVTAIKRFQNTMNLNPTGVATEYTQKQLYSSGAPAYEADMPADDAEEPVRTPAPTAEYVALSKGDSGSRVTRLQNRLIKLGYLAGSADGVYGTATVNAVKRFQSELGLSASGKASAALQKKLFSTSAPSYSGDSSSQEESSGYVRLAQGSVGSRVKLLQSRLRELGYLSGSVDGSYGSSTVRAVKLFQRALGLDETGTASASLQKRLYADSAPYYDGDSGEDAGSGEYSTLSPGDSGAAVKRLQQRLKALGWFDGEIGGNYLTLTTEAVKRFQGALGLNKTGIATAALQKKLFSASAPDNSGSGDDPGKLTALREGDVGSSVKRLQQRLADLGYYSGSVNGSFGRKTAQAVMRFEARYGKPETGVATAALQKKLYASDALPYRADATPEPSLYQKLQRGDSGAAVKRLQKRLQELGYFEGEIGGNYLDLTVQAVKAFQRALGVSETGAASAALQETLFSDDAPYAAKQPDTGTTDPIVYKELKRGMHGSAVTKLQQRLYELGYIKSLDDITVKTFDKATMLAVIDAQIARGYESDGTADQDFLSYIYSDEAWSYISSTYAGG